MNAAIRVLVAEDEAPQRQALLAMLARLWPEAVVVAECEDGLEALEALQALVPQVAFLDIRMPGVSGLDVARAAGAATHVVFTTAYSEYAVEAFERGALDYLLKPLREDRLVHAIDRLRERLRSGAAPDLAGLLGTLEQRLRADQAAARLKWITASVGDTVRLFALEEVLFFQAQDKYTRVVTTTEEALIRTPLKELLAQLDARTFWQVHRSVIVRAAAIRSIRRDEFGRLALTVRGRDDVLPVSSAMQHRFRGM